MPAPGSPITDMQNGFLQQCEDLRKLLGSLT